MFYQRLTASKIMMQHNLIQKLTKTSFSKIHLRLNSNATNFTTKKIAQDEITVKNEKLLKFMLKSKTIAKMYKNPKYSKVFGDLLQSNTGTIFATFMILHEITAVVPLVLLWYFAYKNWEKIDRYYEELLEEFEVNQTSKEINVAVSTETDSGFKNYIISKGHEKLIHFHKVFAKISQKYIVGKTSERNSQQTEISQEELDNEFAKLKKLTLSGATAYIAVKVIAPLRMMVSIYYTPYLSQVIQKTVVNTAKTMFKRI